MGVRQSGKTGTTAATAAAHGTHRSRLPQALLSVLVLLAAFLVLGVGTALADLPAPDTHTWDGGGGDNNWTTAANWAGDTAPAAGDDLVFSGTTRPANTNNFSAGTSFRSVSFTDAGFAITGNALTLTNGIINAGGTLDPVEGNTTWNLSTTLGAAQSFMVNSGNLIFKGAINNGGFLLTVDGAGDSSIGYPSVGGAITGTGGLTKTGAGTLTFFGPGSGRHTYGGDTTISGGVLQLGEENVIPYGAGRGGVVIGADGTLQLYRNSQTVNSLSGAGTVDSLYSSPSLTVGTSDTSSDSSFSGTISGPVGLVKAGTWDLTLSGPNNTYRGATVISGGQLKLGLNNALPSEGSLIVNAGGTLDLNGHSQQVSSLEGGGTVDSKTGTGSFTLTAQAGTFSGVIENTAGTLALTKTSYATLTLSGVNTYTGATTVSDGTLLVNGSLAAGSAVTVAAGKTLGGTGTVAGTVTVNGIVSPGASVGTLTTGAETWNGGGSYTVEMSAAGGIAGTGWDLLSTGGIAVAATSGSTFTIRLVSAGSAVGFNAAQDYTWKIATGAVTGFDATKFTIVTSGFAPLSGNNERFSVYYPDGDIYLKYTPPSPPDTHTWSGAGLIDDEPDPSWSNPHNWVEGTVPSNGDSLVFPAKFGDEDITNLAPYNDMPTTGDESLSSIASVTFSAADYEVTGDTMLTINGAISMTVSGISIWAIPTVVDSGTTLTLSAIGGGELQIGDVVDDVASGGVSGAGSLTAGKLTPTLEDGGAA